MTIPFTGRTSYHDLTNAAATHLIPASLPLVPPVQPIVMRPSTFAAATPLSTFGEFPLVLMAMAPFWSWAVTCTIHLSKSQSHQPQSQ